ncbi:hypothetical protein E2C01_023831 [Portunus trituberculatus]|uniref:Uncharacterized protein n=1 Tax=Portunus trituberculatus TaxID=210409 RepID=A0A5B7ECQ0_PORTR|nr:hypothetical protein [Portunus trituberculatus]
MTLVRPVSTPGTMLRGEWLTPGQQHDFHVATGSFGELKERQTTKNYVDGNQRITVARQDSGDEKYPTPELPPATLSSDMEPCQCSASSHSPRAVMLKKGRTKKTDVMFQKYSTFTST